MVHIDRRREQEAHLEPRWNALLEFDNFSLAGLSDYNPLPSAVYETYDDIIPLTDEYELFEIGINIGSLHYIALVKIGSKWLRFDDSSRSAVAEPCNPTIILDQPMHRFLSIDVRHRLVLRLHSNRQGVRQLATMMVSMGLRKII